MDRSQDIAFWQASAARHDAEGHPAAAITSRNMAWLLEHQQTWLEWCASETANAIQSNQTKEDAHDNNRS